MAIEKINDNEYIVSGNSISDRKFIITKPRRYRVEKFIKRDKGYFGRVISDKGNLRYFDSYDEAVSFIERQDFSKA